MSAAERIESRFAILERRARDGGPGATARRDVRTCTRCGARATFIREASGGWATCTACGRYA
ncbi:MAG: hypothetical protein ACKO8G_03605 [Actinomycetota bacterium]